MFGGGGEEGRRGVSFPNSRLQGGKLHLKLNVGTRPIVNKYCERIKVKSTLKRE